MSTNSTIAKKNLDGSITAIYCHWDGYPSHNGRILLEHYNDEEKINELLSIGNLSCLGDVIGEKVDFDNYRTDEGQTQCVAYGRDRGEKDQGPKSFINVTGAYKKFASHEYNYLYVDGLWTVNDEPLSQNGVLKED